jgi:zinc protease
MHLAVKRLTTKYRATKMLYSSVLITKIWSNSTNAIPMNLASIKGLAIRTILAVAIFGTTQTLAQGQLPPEPERTQLLNGLKVLLWSRPGDEVLIKLRIHSGAAFDLEGKAGEMALLGDMLFPDPTTHEYFNEEMRGRLNVSTNYDSITITMQGRAQDFERIIEILRTALVTTQLTPENLAKTRASRVKIIKDSSISSAMLADRAIAARLFGDFPYSRPSAGTPESLERVERADLMLARDRSHCY